VTSERRRHPRRVPSSGEPIANLRMLTGAVLIALDIWEGGGRAPTTGWQRPGARVEVHLLTRSGRVLQRARVLRATVSSVRPTVVTYDIALAFDGLADTTARVSLTPDERAAEFEAPDLLEGAHTVVAGHIAHVLPRAFTLAPSLEGQPR
jgi:hypothetical protein